MKSRGKQCFVLGHYIYFCVRRIKNPIFWYVAWSRFRHHHRRHGSSHSNTLFTTLLHKASSSHREALAQRNFHRKQSFVHGNFYTQQPLHGDAFTHNKFLHTANFYTKQFSHTEKRLHKASFCAANFFHTTNFCAKQTFAQKQIYTKQALALRNFDTHTQLYPEKLLHREALTQSKFFHRKAFTQQTFAQRNFYTQQVFAQRSFYTWPALRQRSSCTGKLSHKANSCTEKLLHKASFCAEKRLHTASFYTKQAFAQRSCYTKQAFGQKKFWTLEAVNTEPENMYNKKYYYYKTQKYYACSCHNEEPWRSHSTAICKQWGAKPKRTTHTGFKNCSDLQLQNRISPSKRNNVDFEALLKRDFKRKINIAPKSKKNSCRSSIRNSHAAITMRFTTVSWKRQKYYACSCRNEEPWRSHSTATCKQWGAKRKRITHTGSKNCSDLQLQNRISPSKRNNVDFEALLKRDFKRKINIAPKSKKIAAKGLLCTTELAQSTSQYYCVLQSLHKARPSTTLHYSKARTKHVPVLLCTTKLSQSTSQYYFVLPSLHKARPSTTLYYRACTKHVQYYFVLQSLHTARPSTTL